MNLRLLVVPFMLSFMSCTDYVMNEDETHVEVKAVILDHSDWGIEFGRKCVEQSQWCQDLQLSDELKKKFERNPNDIYTIMECIDSLKMRPQWGDTVGESEEWWYYCEWYTTYVKFM